MQLYKIFMKTYKIIKSQNHKIIKIHNTFLPSKIFDLMLKQVMPFLKMIAQFKNKNKFHNELSKCPPILEKWKTRNYIQLQQTHMLSLDRKVQL
ncbi:hypothetical protein pb186bvf_006846 [Paramecium bursaria]